MRRLPEVVFHIVDAVNWDSIQRRGLLCANDLIGGAGAVHRPAAGLREHRPTSLTLDDGCLLRDQSPMPPQALARCLDQDTSPADWYALVNGCIFFWLGRDRVESHLGALRGRPQLLLTIDTDRLVERHGGRAFVTPFNIGYAGRKGASRGARTLVPVADWAANGWASEAARGGRLRPSSHRPVELIVREAIPDLADLIVSVEPIRP